MGEEATVATREFHRLGLAELPEVDSWKPFSDDYDGKVFSFTKFEKNRRAVLDVLVRCSSGMGRALNMGTGPTTYLNRELLRLGLSVVATDFCAAMLESAGAQLSHERLSYELADSRNLAYEAAFDNVLAINSILPPARADVVSMFASARRALRPGGRFIATLIPHDNALYMIRGVNKNWQLVDAANKIEIDTNGLQCNHDPETIHAEMSAAGWESSEYSIRVIYLDSPEECADIERLYAYPTGKPSPITGKPLAPWYELILLADKRRN